MLSKSVKIIVKMHMCVCISLCGNNWNTQSQCSCSLCQIDTHLFAGVPNYESTTTASVCRVKLILDEKFYVRHQGNMWVPTFELITRTKQTVVFTTLYGITHSLALFSCAAHCRLRWPRRTLPRRPKPLWAARKPPLAAKGLPIGCGWPPWLSRARQSV